MSDTQLPNNLDYRAAKDDQPRRRFSPFGWWINLLLIAGVLLVLSGTVNLLARWLVTPTPDESRFRLMILLVAIGQIAVGVVMLLYTWRCIRKIEG